MSVEHEVDTVPLHQAIPETRKRLELMQRCAGVAPVHCHWCAQILPAHADDCPVRP